MVKKKVRPCKWERSIENGQTGLSQQKNYGTVQLWWCKPRKHTTRWATADDHVRVHFCQPRTEDWGCSVHRIIKTRHVTGGKNAECQSWSQFTHFIMATSSMIIHHVKSCLKQDSWTCQCFSPAFLVTRSESSKTLLGCSVTGESLHERAPEKQICSNCVMHTWRISKEMCPTSCRMTTKKWGCFWSKGGVPNKLLDECVCVWIISQTPRALSPDLLGDLWTD